MNYVIQGILSGQVANNGSLPAMAYPLGTTYLDFDGAAGHSIIVNQSTYTSPDDITVTFNTNSIAVVNKSGKAFPVGGVFFLDIKTYQGGERSFPGVRVRNEFVGGPAAITLDNGNTLDHTARISFVTSTTDDGWSGIQIGMNIVPSDNGVGTRSQTAGAKNYLQFERSWDNGLGDLLTGTVTVAAGGTSVTGSGTAFLSEVTAGGYYYFGGESKLIASVESNTAMTLTNPHTAGVTAGAIREKQGQNEFWVALNDARVFQANSMDNEPTNSWMSVNHPIILNPEGSTHEEWVNSKIALVATGGYATRVTTLTAGVGNSGTFTSVEAGKTQASYIHYGTLGDIYWRSASPDGYVYINDSANATGGAAICSATGKLAFHGVTPVARQPLATGTGKTVDNVITALQTLGLLKQA